MSDPYASHERQRSELDRDNGDRQPMGEPASTHLDSKTWLDEASPASARTGPPVPTFLEGEKAAGRFRIIRMIGQGGMGQVFEAFDEELSTRVALKVIRPEIAASSRAMELFKSEVQLARTVTHPNVCRLFDLFTHDPGPANWGRDRQPVRFVTMEMLDGESLRRRLLRSPAPRAEEGLAWARQLTDGLAAIHRAGVTHRDLKPDNVLLVADAGDGQATGSRPVITDFGLAVTDRRIDRKISPAGGTRAYSAPEQWQDAPLTPAADVYSFGLLLLDIFEVIGGRPARPADLSPKSPVERLDRLRSPWSRTLRRCFDPEPTDRYADGEALHQALFPSVRRKRSSLWVVGGLILGILILSTLAQRLGWSRTLEPVDLSAASAKLVESMLEQPVVEVPRPTLFIEPFTATHADDTWLAEILEAGLESVFQSHPHVRLPRRPASANPVGSPGRPLHWTADAVLRGRVVRGPGDDRASLRWSLRATAEPAEAVDLSAEQSFDLEDRPVLETIAELSRAAAQVIRGSGGRLELDGEHIAASLSGYPRNEASLRTLAEARAALRRMRPQDSLEKLRQLEVLDPDSREIALVRAEALSVLGFDRRAAAAAEKAFQLADEALPEVRQRLEARSRLLDGQWSAAIELYRSLWARYPDDTAYGLTLAEAELLGEGVDAAAATLSRLRDASLGPVDHLHEVLLRTRLARQRGEYAQQLSAARGAGRRASDLQAPEQLLEALLLEADVLMATEDETGLAAVRQRFDQLAASGLWPDLRLATAMLRFASFGGLNQALPLGLTWEQAQGLFLEAGNLRDSARVQGFRAMQVRGDAQQRPDAIVSAQEALATARRAGSPRAEAEIHRVLGVLRHLDADHAIAADHFAASLEAARQVGEIVLVGGALHNLALEFHRVGRLREAQERFAEARDLFAAIGERRGQAMTLFQSGTLLVELGDLEAASASLEEARQQSRQHENLLMFAMATERLAHATELRGRDEQARELFAQALQAYDAVTESGGDRTRLYLASRLGETGTAEEVREAEAEIRRHLAAAATEPGTYHHILCRAYLAQTLVRQDRLEEAAQLLVFDDQEQRLIQDRRLAHTVQSAIARVESARGQTEAAVARIQDQLAEAEAYGSVYHQLELRLLLGQILKSDGRETAAASQLESVLREAEDLGFLGLVRRAGGA